MSAPPARWADLRSRHRSLFWVLALLLGGVPAFAQNGERPGEDDTVVPISAALCKDMKQRHVLNPGSPVACERLRLVKFGYLGFDGQLHGDGEIVVMDAVADHIRQIFATLRQRRFPIAKARLMNAYNGDDDASMDQDNTSAFNVRNVAGSSAISLHAYGVAIDLNPIENPYVLRSRGTVAVSPKSGAAFANRKNLRPGMAETIIDVFADHGLTTWGGTWNNPIDYQHFQVSRKLAGQLARASSAQSRALFERHVERYRACRATAKSEAARRACATAE
jgi:hypothetical protein